MSDTRREVRWDYLLPKEFATAVSECPVCYMPLGTLERHGAHLPLAVDMCIPSEIARRVSAIVRVPVLPCLPYGNSLTHRGWPGTISLRPQTLRRVVEEIFHWPYEYGFRRAVILNGHLANQWPLMSAVENLRYDLPDLRVRMLGWWEITPEVEREVRTDAVGPSFHGNDAETSAIMYLRPEQVRMDRVDTEQSTERPFFSYPMRFRTSSGVTGDPLTATPERGKALVEMAVAGLSESLRKALREEPPVS